ncbi:MAG: HlyD family efflux transporter periplasmic adaptor subunit, partial [Synechococcaceae bacterium WB9_4xB_025]|nr:HlyD family efflux transporter periplasmic adaptor subunit [Synechococcaceae bacterium WB9_4xB_025]
GVVLKVITRVGERSGTDGVLEVGASQEMEALIEVYESDVNRIRLGQAVTLVSENGGFSGRLEGEVMRISPQVRQRRVLSTDPTGDADARIVEVRVRLNAESAARVTRLAGMKVIARFQNP